VPGGAAPSYAHGYYDRDNAAYLEWDTISRDRETFTAWLRDVEKGSPEKGDPEKGEPGTRRRRP
jgi:glutaconate CoA-transferase, subunit A